MTDSLSLSLDLIRRLPPTAISNNLDLLVSLCPSLADDLYSSVDQPLKIRVDAKSQGREYLACDYNRDGDSWRSPHSNEYDPPLEDGTKPSASLRELEIKMGAAMDSYRQLYYDTGLSSVYLWDLDDGAFAGVVLFKKGELSDHGTSERGPEADLLPFPDVQTSIHQQAKMLLSVPSVSGTLSTSLRQLQIAAVVQPLTS